MKTALLSLRCFALVAAALVAAKADGAQTPLAANKSAPIPLDQLGAVAGKQYQGDGLSVTATPEGARLQCVFQRLEGRATPEGLWLTSTSEGARGERFRVVASAVGRQEGGRASPRALTSSSFPEILGLAGTLALPEAGKVVVTAQLARFIRPGLTEEYSVSMDGVRQDFIIEAPPLNSQPSTLNARAGQLRVELEVIGARAEPLVNGARLVLDGSGRKLAYSRLRATDATGRELSARLLVNSDAEPRMDESNVAEKASTLDKAGADADRDSVLECGSPLPLWHDWGAAESGRGLPHSKTSRNTARLSVIVDDADALYPVRIDPTFSDDNWISMGGLPGANSNVYAAVADAAGNLYIGGAFTIVGDVIVNHVAKWNGSAWSALGSGIDRIVYALAVSGTNLYAAGDFNYATNAGPSAVTVNGIAKWNGSAWSALGSGMNNPVLALAVSGTNLYAAGAFTTADGSPANYIAKWNGSDWSALGSGMDSVVYALAVSGTNLYAGGDFTYATNAGPSALNVNGIAKWDGSEWSALGSGMSAAVYALAVSGTDLYAGGYFSYATNAGPSAVNVNCIAKWDGSAWSALGSGMGSYDHWVYALAVSGTDLYVGGEFTYATNAGSSAVSVNAIAKWNGSVWSALGSGMNELGSIYALAVSGTNLYTGGNFITAGGSAASCVAKWDGSAWSPLGSGFGGDTPYVHALAVLGTDLYAGGDFITAGGNAANYIAKWNGSTWSALGSGMDWTVYALAASGTNLYAGGGFTTAGGRAANCIAKWDGSAWSPLGSGMGGGSGLYPYVSYVYALAVSGTDLYVGGDFTYATNAGPSAVNVNRIAKWNGSAWSALGSGMNDWVMALAVSGTDLYTGGQFTTAGGVTVNRIAKWNGSTWSALGSGMNYYVYALALSGNDLYAGGRFAYATNAGPSAVSVKRVAKWDGSAWSALGSGLNNTVVALAASGTDLYAGGDFWQAGGSAANYIAKWDGNAWSPLGSGVGGGPGPYNTRVSALAMSGMDLYAGGNFSTVGGRVSAYVAKANLGGNMSAVGGRFSSLAYTPATGFTCLFSDATVGQPYRIQTSLSPAAGSWAALTNFTYTGPITITDTSAATSNRFYRAVSP